MQTRRERNARFGRESPEIEVPTEAEHVWDWFFELSQRRRSGPEALSFGEVGEWQRLTGNIIRPEEVRMIMAMDDAYVAEARKEQADMAERQREAAKQGSK